MDIISLFSGEIDSSGEENHNTVKVDDSNKENEDEEVEDSYEGFDLTIPARRYEHLEINGQDFDLRDPIQCQEALERTTQLRTGLKSGDLLEYEGKSTQLWGGGRSRLFHDELMSKLAYDFHQGKHNLSFDQMNIEANRIQSIRAAQLKAEGL